MPETIVAHLKLKMYQTLCKWSEYGHFNKRLGYFYFFAYLSVIYSVHLRPQLTSAKHFFWCQKRRQTLTFLDF